MLVNRNKHILIWAMKPKVVILWLPQNYLPKFHKFTFNKNTMQSKLFILFFLNLPDKIGKNYVVRFIYYQKLSNEQLLSYSYFEFPLKILY